jgi:hypothetical protein
LQLRSFGCHSERSEESRLDAMRAAFAAYEEVAIT